MPRDIPVGNRNCLICFDDDYRIRDLYYPHVGQESHVGGETCRFGVQVEGVFSWVGPDWERDLAYLPETLVTEVTLFNKRLGLRLICHDAVDFHEDIYVRQVTVENLQPRPREVDLFFGLVLNISGNDVGDTASFEPETGGILHYKGARYFLANGMTDDSDKPAQFATGKKKLQGKEGTFRDAEDGQLSGNPIAQGSVDSVLSLNLHLDALGSGKGYYWISMGKHRDEAVRLSGLVRQKGPEALVRRTTDYWRIWIRKETPPLNIFSEKVQDLYRKSLLILSTQIDGDGGILAANDSDVIQFNRDTYSYIWPRDGALVAHTLDVAGYPVPAEGFYRFISRVMGREGYLLHKYNPDGTPASSWHPWIENGIPQLPIQEDETALVIWALWHHFVIYRDLEFIKPLYRPLIIKSADFLASYRDEETGLPAPSYDLWEERRGILSFTTGAVFGGLTAAALFATVFGETAAAEKYRKAAAEIRDAASAHLWRPDLNRFCRMLMPQEDGGFEVDGTRDASLWGLFAFGLYRADDPRIVSTMTDLKETLWVKTAVGGLARYEGDYYHRVSQEVPGNPWFICTLWYADYLIDIAQGEDDMKEAIDIIDWVAGHALRSGVLAEQVHPYTGEPLSVSPLTWSHATFVATIQRLVRHLGKMKTCPTCHLPADSQLRREDWLETLYAEACDGIHGMCRL
ncbi:MAG: glycoside hydrolase family 15 protein [bacterium]|nr:glycoside hydrolase family 15 protein [bacterium]